MHQSPLQKNNTTASKVVANNNANKTGIGLPAVPVLQNKPLQKKELGEEEPIQTKLSVQLKSNAAAADTNLIKPNDTVAATVQPKSLEHPASDQLTLQKKGKEDELPILGKFTVQQKEFEEKERPIQGRFVLQTTTAQGAETKAQPIQRFALSKQPIQMKTNNTGLPDNLKAGVENMSGFNLDDVKVHYNSTQPAQLQAHAYAQGTNIHVAPGQEKHVAHEAWHVVQQKQGRVQPTMQMKGNIPVNDDKGLEQEADIMGAKALQLQSNKSFSGLTGYQSTATQRYATVTVIQANGLFSALKDGTETGNLGTDLIVKILRSQVGEPDWEGKITMLLGAIDFTIAKPAVEGLMSWFYAKLPSSIITPMLSWAAPVYSALTQVHAIFKLLPEPIQNLIVFMMGKGMRKFLGSLSAVLSDENADWMIDVIFVSDPITAIENAKEWVQGLVNRPTTFLYEKWKQSGTAPKKPESEVEVPTESGETGSGETATEGTSAPKIQQRMDSLFNMDTSVVKLQVGKPKVQKGKNAQSKDPSEKVSGGLALPFNFSVHLFGEDLKVDKGNELILPWNGGIYLNIPQATISLNKNLANFFHVGSLAINNLILTEKGLSSMEIDVKDVKIANDTVVFDSIGGRWTKEAGTNLFAIGKINAMNNTPIAIKINLGLNKDGKFDNAGLAIEALKKFEIIDGAFFIENPGFEGFVSKEEVALRFYGSPQLAMGGIELDANQLSIAYNKAASGDSNFEVAASALALKYGKLALVISNPSFKTATKQLHADDASLSYKKSNGAATTEAEWLKQKNEDPGFNWLDMLSIVPEASFSVPNVVLSGTSPYLKMGKPTVASISLSMLGITAMANFKEKRGSIAGGFTKASQVPAISLPFPIVPGLEAYVSIKVGAELQARLAADLSKPDPEKAPWHVGGSAQVNASLHAIIEAGLQAGSQMAIALSAGLYADGRGTMENELSLAGGLQFGNMSIEPVAEDPFKMKYKVGPVITVSTGIRISAKALFVLEKVLYEREFKQWTLGKYQVEGELVWKDGEWKNNLEKNGFEGNKIEAPEHEDKEIAESRQLLLDARVAIANSAELRRKIVLDMIEAYKIKDQEVYGKLDLHSQQLAASKTQKHELESPFLGLGSVFNYSEIKPLRLKIKEQKKQVDKLKEIYLGVLLVLVNVKGIVDGIADERLDLGAGDLNEQIRELHRQDAILEDSKRGSGVEIAL